MTHHRSDALTALWDAYSQSTYLARTSRGEIRIHPGQSTPDLDALLSEAGAAQWAYLTACNPNSERLPPEENGQRQNALRQAVQDRGLTFFEGEGVLDAAVWPPEPSFLILDISADDARSLGRQFGQLAIVVGRPGQVALLMSCDDAVH
ncbi:MAG: DUF3293 domain-containing protein [Acidobacteriota bacterium]